MPFSTATLLLAALAAQPGTEPAGAAPTATLAPPPADPLADLIAALGRLGGSTVVRAQVSHRHTYSQGDDPARPEGLVRATAVAGPDGLQVTWDRALLAEAEREERRLVSDPEAASPVRDALLDLRILALAHVLDPGPELLRILSGARLVEQRDEQKDGAPARLLVLTVTPALSARDRRYVKELSATARVWLGPDGLPVAAEQHVTAKGRAFLVITFDLEQIERLRFTRQGDRLVATHRETEQRSAGAGEKSWRRSVTDLSLLP